MHFNVLSLSRYFAVVFLSRCCLPYPPPPPLWLSFSISLLNKQRQKDYADKFNKGKLKD